MYDVECDGSESSLLDCLHGEIGKSTCTHFEDAGIICICKCTAQWRVPQQLLYVPQQWIAHDDPISRLSTEYERWIFPALIYILATPINLNKLMSGSIVYRHSDSLAEEQVSSNLSSRI